MDRLTRKQGNHYTVGEYTDIYQGSIISKVINKLGEFEDKIENGILVEKGVENVQQAEKTADS